MLKKYSMMIQLLLVVSLLFVFFSLIGNNCYGLDEKSEDEQCSTTDIVDIIENSVDISDADEVIDTNVAYTAGSKGINTTIPKDGKGYITIQGGSVSNMSVSLPKELVLNNSMVSENGTVLFRSENNVDVGVQSVTSTDDCGIREILAIQSKNAPRKFTISLDRKNDRRFITAQDYYSQKGLSATKIVQDMIYIVDRNNEIQAVIEPIVAVDKNGKNVKTVYSIENEFNLVQEIDLTDASFPVIVTTTAHPDRWIKAYYTKNEVEKIRDKYTSDDNDKVRLGKGFAKYGVGMVIALSKRMSTAVGVAWDTLWFLQDSYKSTKYATWNKIYKGFGGEKYVCVAGKERWHHKGAYVAVGALKTSYTNKAN